MKAGENPICLQLARYRNLFLALANMHLANQSNNWWRDLSSIEIGRV